MQVIAVFVIVALGFAYYFTHNSEENLVDYQCQYSQTSADDTSPQERSTQCSSPRRDDVRNVAKE